MLFLESTNVLVDPLVRRRAYDHLRDLEMLGILEVKERYEGRRGGSYYEYELNISLDAVIDVFQDLDNIDDLQYF